MRFFTNKLFYFWVIIPLFIYSNAQTALQNFGNIQIHTNGQIGFHINLVNDGVFNQNLGLAGFYSQSIPLTISGTEIPRFYDLEVEVNNNLFLEINTEINNSVSYILGDIITPRSNPTISLDYLENTFYLLDDNARNTDGYASFNGNTEFIFPIGNDDKLRPIIVTNSTPATNIKAAYFNEDPNFPSVFTSNFSTTSLAPTVSAVSNIEFWDFDGPPNSLVTLTWNNESNIANLVPDLLSLRVVGWHIVDEEWKDLGNSNVTGTITEGTIDSFLYNPSDYEIITFGSLVTIDDINVYNLFSPNDDGVNDTFVIEGIEAFPNQLKIFNRWGNTVYSAKNYQNNWNGVANTNRSLNEGDKLPPGTYFYSLEIKDPKKTSSGWIYINY